MIFLVAYSIIGFLYLVVALINAGHVRDSINRYPGEYPPEVVAKEKADSALLALLTPVWPGVVLFFVARVTWMHVKDVRAYYFKSNRKEGDR